MKKTLCLDFDGVVHQYVSPWVDAVTIPDPPVPGAVEFLQHASRYFTVAIFSSRSHVVGGVEAMQTWLLSHMRAEHRAGVNPVEFVTQTIRWPRQKPPAHLYIDDRGMHFDGNWGHYDPVKLLEFKTWSGR